MSTSAGSHPAATAAVECDRAPCTWRGFVIVCGWWSFVLAAVVLLTSVWGCPLCLLAVPLDVCSVSQLSCSQFHSAALTPRGHVYTWGRGAGGALARELPKVRSDHSPIKTSAVYVERRPIAVVLVHGATRGIKGALTGVGRHYHR